MPHTARPRLTLLFSCLFVLVVIALDLPNRLLGQWAYAVERGRIQADVEELARLEEVSHAFRLVAKAAKPGVVNIQVTGSEADLTELEKLQDRENELNNLRDRIEAQSDTEEPIDPEELQQLHDGLLKLQRDRRDLLDRVQDAAGSGIVYDEEGHILTNNHVVGGHSEIRVQLPDNREYKAVLVGADPETDLALIKIDAAGLHPLTFGDSDAMEVGDWVLSVGAPFGLAQSVTHGIISARGRTNINTGRRQIVYQDFLQTDAAINPGNSGGPLLNIRGQVIGVNTAIATNGDSYNAGIAFTIPSNMAMKVAEQLKDAGKVARGWLGVTMGMLDKDDREVFGAPDGGVMLDIILLGTPADDAGLQVEDVVEKINGQPVRTNDEMLAVIADIFPGEDAKLDVIRAGERMTVTTKLGRRPDNVQRARLNDRVRQWCELPDVGILVGTLRPASTRGLGFDEDQRGVLVTGFPVAYKDLKIHDLIVEYNGDPITTAGTLVARFAAEPSGTTVKLGVKNADGETRTVEIERP